MILYLTFALLLLGGIVLFFFMVYRVRLNRSIREKNELEVRNVQALLETKVEIRDQTLKDVSREIHDNIAQVLSLAKLHLSSAQTLNPEQVLVRLNSAKSLLSLAIQDLRDLSRILPTGQVSKFDFISAIEHQVDQIIKVGNHEVDLAISGSVSDIGQQRSIVLFRIIQESLQNVLKHAGASRIELYLNYSNDNLTVCVADNGSGFDAVNGCKGQGLSNIRERAQLVGALCDVASSIGRGTVIKIVLPINRVKDES